MICAKSVISTVQGSSVKNALKKENNEICLRKIEFRNSIKNQNVQVANNKIVVKAEQLQHFCPWYNRSTDQTLMKSLLCFHKTR